MTEVVKNTTNPDMRRESIGKSTNCEAVDWSTTAHVQKPCDLKKALISIDWLQLWQESYVSKACDWNFHGKYPISSLPSMSIKTKWRRTINSNFLISQPIDLKFYRIATDRLTFDNMYKKTNKYPSSVYVKKCV